MCRQSRILRFFLLAALMVGPVFAVDVPFSTANTIDGDFDRATSIHAADAGEIRDRREIL